MEQTVLEAVTQDGELAETSATFLDAEVRDAAHAVSAALNLAHSDHIHPGVRPHLVAAKTQLEAVARLLDIAAA